MKRVKFNAHTARYDPDNALLLAQSALLVYKNRAEIEQQVQAWRLTKFKFFDKKETQAFLAADDTMIILAFRGTEANKLLDWMSDARIRRRQGPGGMVHRGFLGALKTHLEGCKTDTHRVPR
ncbi:MAG: hypothetical protein GKS05_06625 [Nitrospirales bacterium]|nr:hypothetical protein [Nitrospirales bacterium]